MGLTIKMRIDEHDEHTYVFSTGDGGEIELIPLSVVANGNYSAPDGKAYNLVSVNVPLPEIKTLNITENGTYEAEDGTVWNVVNVDVEPLLQSKSVYYDTNGTYTVEPDSGKDGLSSVSVQVDVPRVVDLQNKTVSISANGSTSVSADTGYDGLGTVTMNTNVPNTYTQADEGKVVRNGSLVAQTANVELTENGTYDTTRIASVTVSVSGGVSNIDVAYVTDPGMSGKTKLINIRQGEQPQAIYVFSAAPDSLSYSDADIITNFACCINSTYDGINYTYDSVVESKNVNLPIPTLDFNERLILDGYVPTILPYSSGIDAFGIDSEILYGYFLDGNENTGFGLMGDYIVVVVYDVQPPL